MRKCDFLMKKLKLQTYVAILYFIAFFAPSMARAESGGSFDVGAVLSHHLMDSVVVEFNLGGEKIRPGDSRYDHSSFRRYTFRDEQGLYRWEGGIPLHLTKRVMMMFVISVILILFLVGAARRIAKNPMIVNGRYANFVEVFVDFLRKDVVAKNMHGHHGKGFESYILSLFFFVLFGNLFGLVPSLGELASTVQHAVTGTPFGHHSEPGDTVPLIIGLWSGITITGDVAVTAALSIVTVLMIWITGFRYQGVGFLWSFLPHGLHPLVVIFLFPMLFVLELVIGPIAKGFALTVRLLANMTAGHVIILALIGFIFQFGLHIAPISIVGAGAIYMLEIFVAFLQAFIFTLLTAIFIGGSMHAH